MTIGPKPRIGYYANRGLIGAKKFAIGTGKFIDASYRGAKRLKDTTTSRVNEAKRRYDIVKERELAKAEAKAERRLAKAERVAALRAKEARIRKLKASTPKKRISYGREYNPFGNDAILGTNKPTSGKQKQKQKDYDYSPFRF